MNLDLPPTPAWFREALCVSLLYPDAWFPDSRGRDGGNGRSTAHAKTVCAVCPVRNMCLEYAVEHRLEGIWGGTTESERERLRRAA